MSKQIPQAYSPVEIEAMAVTTAAQFVVDLGFQHAILETDSLVLAKALHDDTEFLSAVGLVLNEIRSLVNLFYELHYSHIKREGNIVTHKLASSCYLCFRCCSVDGGCFTTFNKLRSFSKKTYK